ncbi:MAG: 2-isopropylmalate synthase [Rickettsiales bacterium]|nr:2-isopropylmalate synthase [Rickettsiales bacterium]OUV53431.1 MAG: 2-isopropylmalate synthase [Rickettsiales bacterium TMED127]|tara:strand:+ start:9940 stop:11535 length:1596 start_codon:yes stop_codon:yes gene_type:complete
MNKKLSKNKDKIYIFDTTLRDGEQSAGASMSVEDKLKIAEILDDMRVDIVEAGFPFASKGDYESVKRISQVLKNSIVCGLARAQYSDIDIAGEAMKNSKRFRIHTFISTSDLHMKYKLKMNKNDVLEAIKKSIQRASKFTDDIEWSPEDASRTNIDFLYKTIQLAIESGASTINIPDTVGYSIPSEFGNLICGIKNNVSNIDKATISVHCHNDLGLAVSNSLSAIVDGARQVECTINGIGERAGNAALEEIVMCLKTRDDFLNFYTDIDATKIIKASNIVAATTGFNVQPNKAIVGKNAFAHESGIHQDGMLKHSDTYEIMKPESVGLSSSELVLGKHSGRHAFKVKLNELGFNLNESELKLVFKKFKDLADKKKQIFEEDIYALMDEQSVSNQNLIQLVDLKVSCGNKLKASAKINLIVFEKKLSAESLGEGPIDAIFKSIKKLVPNESQLILYQVNALTKGVDAQADVSVRLEENGITVLGHGKDIDTMVASAKSYISALNKLINKRERISKSSVKWSKVSDIIDKHAI